MTRNQLQKNIPPDWRRARLGDLGEAIIGLTYAPQDVVASEGILVLRSSNVKNGKIKYEDRVLVDLDVKEKLILKEGDILICSRNGSKNLIGKSAYIDKKAAGNTFGAFMTVYRTEMNRYAKFLFQSRHFIGQIRRDLGPTINQVTTGNLNKFQFLIPPPLEQSRIVFLLETWDQAINTLERKIEFKQRLKNGLMYQLLTGKKRLSGFQKEWTYREIGELLDYEQPTQYLVKDTEYADEYKTPVLTAGKTFVLGYTNEKEGIYDGAPVIIFDDFTAANKFVNFPFKVKSSAMKLLTPKSKDINLKFIFERMQMIDFPIGEHKRQYLSDYQYISIKVPCAEEQEAIAKCSEVADKEISLLKQKLEARKQQKKFLLNNLVTGKIRTPETLNIKSV